MYQSQHFLLTGKFCVSNLNTLGKACMLQRIFVPHKEGVLGLSMLTHGEEAQRDTCILGGLSGLVTVSLSCCGRAAR